MTISTKIHKISKVLTFNKYVRDSRGAQHEGLLSSENPILLDTSIGSHNAGDHIIMHYAQKQLNKIWDNLDDHLPVHVLPESLPHNTRDRLKILCGTNVLSARADNMRLAARWLELPKDTSLYAHSILTLAVGMRDIRPGQGITDKTAMVLNYLFTDQYVHSVRDSHTEQALNAIGITNVVNTSCVTMWDLTPQLCASIPTDKATDVLTTITDYDFDPDNDSHMLHTLQKHYRNVYLWLQGMEDYDKLQTLADVEGIRLVHGGFAGLQEFVATHEDFDYFGTRLHCGIYCLNHGIRSMIVIIDNRAADIQKDTNIPAVHRASLKQDMVGLIENPRVTDIRLPQEAIDLWRRQFIGGRDNQ